MIEKSSSAGYALATIAILGQPPGRLSTVIGDLSNGLKPRERSCPYAVLAPGSGVRVIEDRKFLMGKAAGCWKCVGITEVACIDSRGSRDGMLWRIDRGAREVGMPSTDAYKETKAQQAWRIGSRRGL
jgi:hypothetical protein